MVSQSHPIKDYTFFDCPLLSQIKIPSSVMQIGKFAFNESVTILNSN